MQGSKITVFLMLTIFFLSTFLLFQVSQVYAVPAYPGPIEVEQPDGTTFTARINGDEFENWETTEDESGNDIVIIQDTDDVWKYAEVSYGQLEPTSAVVGVDPVPTQAITGSEWSSTVNQYSQKSYMPEFYYSVQEQPTGGPQKVLVLLVSFTDRTIQYSESAWNNSFFGDTGETVKNYYKENSGGSFYFTPAQETYGTANDGIVKISLGYSHPNTGSSTGDANRLIVKNALIAADPYINYSSYDTNGNGYIENSELHIVTIIAGYERSCGFVTPNVWGHRWSFWGTVSAPQLDGKFLGQAGYGGYTQQGETHAAGGDHMATIGILSHELGHDLGAVDLYNTNSGAAVVGASSVMDGGSWGAGPGEYVGQTPAHFDPWHKQFLDFIDPTVTASGEHIVKAAATGQYNALRINTSDPDEYFLVENRNRSGFDDGLYYDGIFNGGIAIWHIEEAIIGAYKSNNTVNGTGHNPGVWLEKAGASNNPYFRVGGISDVFNDTTTPNSKLYSGAASGVAVSVLDSTATSMRVRIGEGASLQFSPETYSVDEGAGNVALTVARTGDTSGIITIDYTSSNGTASAVSDYTPVSGTLAFADGETNKVITVPIIDDGISESNETFTVTLSNPSSGDIAIPNANITITDNECALSFNPTAYTVSESDGNVNLTITRIGTTSTAITVDYASADGTAAAGADYTDTSGTLSFLAGQTSKTITVPIINDTAFEGEEDFTIVLSNPTNGAVIGSGTATVTISANDTPAISISPENTTVSEAVGTVTFTVTRNGGPETPVSVDYTTVNGTAAAGSDYTAASGTLDFGVGELTKTFDVNITDDADTETDEAFTINLGNPAGGAVITGGAATVTITDNDVSAALSFDPESYTIAEDGGSVALTVIRAQNTTGTVSVDYATQDDSAAAGTDYTAASGTLEFADGEDTKQITVNIAADDADSDGDKEFRVVLSNPAGNAVINVAAATVTIQDNEAPAPEGEVVKILPEVSSGTLGICPAGGTQTLTIIAVYENGATEDITALAVWSSEYEDVATVDAGVITGIAPGITNISFTYNGKIYSFLYGVE